MSVIRYILYKVLVADTFVVLYTADGVGNEFGYGELFYLSTAAVVWYGVRENHFLQSTYNF